MPKFPFCLKCLSHDIVKLRSGKFSCLNCKDRWEPGKQEPRKMSLEREVVAYISGKQHSGVDLLEVQGFYFTRKKRLRRKMSEKTEV